ncbi:MAG: hypothetical protein NWF03_06225, partial [Candidatus Bathyarchaeota archaeon]|nr:hypothetical protein [Candidatus Bathyarchaeota archaeon]
MYNELYNIWKAEKELLDIQRLPNKFYAKIVDYIKKMKEENRMLDKKTTKAKLMETEFAYVQFMVCDLFDLRYKKLKEKTLNQETISRDVLTAEEAKMCGTILPLAEHYNAFCKDIL